MSSEQMQFPFQSNYVQEKAKEGAEKGAELGAIYGPFGAGFGAGWGAALGYLDASTEEMMGVEYPSKSDHVASEDSVVGHQ
jgi:hypothetical protein